MKIFNLVLILPMLFIPENSLLAWANTAQTDERLVFKLYSQKPVEELPDIVIKNGEGGTDGSIDVRTGLNIDPETHSTELSLELSFLSVPAESTMPLIVIGDRITVTQVAVNLIKAADYYAPLLLDINLSENQHDYIGDLRNQSVYLYSKYIRPVGRQIKESFAKFADEKNIQETRRWTAIPWFAIVSAPKVAWSGICALKDGPEILVNQFLLPYRLGEEILVKGDIQGGQQAMIDGYVNGIAANGIVAGAMGFTQLGVNVLAGGKNLIGNLSPNAVQLAANNGLTISGVAGGAAAEGSCVALGGFQRSIFNFSAGSLFSRKPRGLKKIDGLEVTKKFENEAKSISKEIDDILDKAIEEMGDRHGSCITRVKLIEESIKRRGLDWKIEAVRFKCANTQAETIWPYITDPETGNSFILGRSLHSFEFFKAKRVPDILSEWFTHERMTVENLWKYFQEESIKSTRYKKWLDYYNTNHAAVIKDILPSLEMINRQTTDDMTPFLKVYGEQGNCTARAKLNCDRVLRTCPECEPKYIFYRGYIKSDIFIELSVKDPVSGNRFVMTLDGLIPEEQFIKTAWEYIHEARTASLEAFSRSWDIKTFAPKDFDQMLRYSRGTWGEEGWKELYQKFSQAHAGD